MIDAFRNAFKITELRKRIIFTALLLIIYRVGAHITIPGIDNEAVSAFFDNLMGKVGLIGFVDLFSGGALRNMTIFALGIQPYISASIILQLLTVVVPYLERISKEPDGRKKITQYTRYGTVLLAAVQGIGISFMLRNPASLGLGFAGSIVKSAIPLWQFHFLAVITLAAGTSFIMWLGEQITERGIGNGISLIITAGIVAGIPRAISSLYTSLTTEGEQHMGLIELVFFIALIVIAVMGTIYITLAVRKIPVQHSRRVVGRRIYGGQANHIPLRVNAAGMIPIIFAVTLISFPQTLVTFIPSELLKSIVLKVYSPLIYWPAYALLIIFFTYFYTAVQINPVDWADNLRKSGGYIPGIRPGRATAQYIERTLDRITLPGAVFLAVIAVLPALLQKKLGVQAGISGASILIVVGVMLDTMNQIESYLVSRHYNGFLKGTKLRGRRGG